MLIFLYFWKYAIKQARHKSEVTDVKKKVKLFEVFSLNGDESEKAKVDAVLKKLNLPTP